jgi:hypothetical protein
MIIQKEYKVCLSRNGKLLFKNSEGKSFRLDELNKAGKKLISIFDIRENETEILEKVAVFQWEEK